MAKIRFVPDYAGFRALRTRPDLMAKLNERADRIAEAAGKGFVARHAEVTGGRGRGRASVGAVTPRAMVVQARDHVLERSL